MNKRQNLKEALRMLDTIPLRNFDLEIWRRGMGKDQPPNCGTIACFGGWVAWWPAFRALGVKVSFDGAPYMRGGVFSEDVAERVFGDHEIFYPRGMHFRDHDLDLRSVTDLEIVRHRIKCALESL